MVMWLPFGSINLIFEPIELKQTLNNQQIVFLNAGRNIYINIEVQGTDLHSNRFGI